MLNPKDKIGHYSIVAQIGAGGMGEVYRATDSNLGRDVALKVLPAAFAADRDRMARFQREAQLLAALNHPNIATIHGLETAGEQRALAMELVEGPTLADRIAQGAIPVEEAMPIAKQIAEALEYAHERGIIHRDLKPANIKLTRDGAVKVLDFGLAKALADDPASTDIASSPTLSIAATKAGLILGTAAYMPPEQAKGKTVDRRADIWSFGCVLFEMLTGKKVFDGETVTDALAAVVRAEPEWSLLPATSPPPIRNLLRRCLEKDPKQRLRDIGEARIAIAECIANPHAAQAAAASTVTAPAATGWQRLLPWGVALGMTVLATVALWGWLRPLPSSPLGIHRYVVDMPKGQVIGVEREIALSPDGNMLVYQGSRLNAPGWQLFLKSMDQLAAVPLGDEEGAARPFFSPDGQWVGYYSAGKLKKISVRGGPPVTLCEVINLRGANWGRDGTIVFADSVGVLMRVSDSGGTPQALTKLDLTTGETGHRWPEFLPDGDSVLFGMQIKTNLELGRISILSLKTGKTRTVMEGGSNPHYLSSGHIVYAQLGTVMAVPFDLDRLEITGNPTPVLEAVHTDAVAGAASYSVCADGTLVYIPGSAFGMQENSFVWVDRKGTERPMAAPARAYQWPKISPDGRQLVVRIADANIDVWVYDMPRGTLSRVTFQPDEDETAIWTPDGKKLVYSSSLGSKGRVLLIRNADGSGQEEIVWQGGVHTHVSAISPDGRRVVFTDYDPATRGDIWVLSLEGEGKPQPFLKTTANECDAKISRNGQWLAYTSDESGRNEVYVHAFPNPTGKWQISTNGGDSPVWSRDGKELFYRNGGKMMVAAIVTSPMFSSAVPRELFDRPYLETPRREANYDVTPDGNSFLMVKGLTGGMGPTRYHVVVNWTEDLKRRVPTK